MPGRFRQVLRIPANSAGYDVCKTGEIATATMVTKSGALSFLLETVDAVTGGNQLAQSLRQPHATQNCTLAVMDGRITTLSPASSVAGPYAEGRMA